ncbi:uncharacterized protein STEHIDRAFT_163747 [Stereum hirsutum FP-91666 SS1]|uniref:Uncharacterized protein n=1 Tax=Stereum hirsutum (strain FP-91666) TaxID=721885 RepID=R7RVY2_STEHR|nr:uncharacterized protein STEHIDRAFT_163747 [Stereum hirsutum FP-91666 SS1]EIM79389.1 hypothetical protein STEHIDRAFT_163747 [Stereum hirsutum FP-91666 SS1]
MQYNHTPLLFSLHITVFSPSRSNCLGYCKRHQQPTHRPSSTPLPDLNAHRFSSLGSRIRPQDIPSFDIDVLSVVVLGYIAPEVRPSSPVLMVHCIGVPIPCVLHYRMFLYTLGPTLYSRRILGLANLAQPYALRPNIISVATLLPLCETRAMA